MVLVGILKKRNHLDLKRTNWHDVDCIHLVQVRDKWQALVNMVNKPSGAKSIWEFLDQLETVSFSLRTLVLQISYVGDKAFRHHKNTIKLYSRKQDKEDSEKPVFKYGLSKTRM